MQDILLRIPRPYLPIWSTTLQVAQHLIGCSEHLKNQDLWPILGLSKKAAATTKGIASLISLELWSDALVLGRTLTDIEIIIKWLLGEDTENRIRKYLSGIDQERTRLLRKMGEGRSASYQIMNELIDPASLGAKAPIGEIGIGWSGLTLRDMSAQVDLEWEYDVTYWIASAFVHSHALSVLDWNQERKKEEQVLAKTFSRDEGSFLQWGALAGIPCASLHIFGLADRALGLGLGEEIASAWATHRQCISEIMKKQSIRWSFSDKVPPGDLVILQEHSGKLTEKVYSPKRVPRGGTKRKRRR